MFKFFGREARRLANRVKWSVAGLKMAWSEELSLRFWVVVNLFCAIVVFTFDFTGVERAVLLSLGLLIVVAELFNTAIERTVDHISLERHPLAKAAKDAGSAAVAVTAFATLVAWVCILFA